MKCEGVTITGADDSTDVEQLVAWSKTYPFVEWGILLSARQEGTARFPSLTWMNEFATAAHEHNLKVAAHLCGRWVREMLVGTLDHGELPSVAHYAQRIQINTHAEPHEFGYAMIDQMHRLGNRDGKEFIFQRDGLRKNAVIAHGAKAGGVKTAILFDTSGGAGELPAEWPAQEDEFHCGYAGGLGPDNVLEQIKRIEEVTTKPYWIDMERRVRVADDSRLDVAAVVTVLEKFAALRRAAEVGG